MLQLLTSCVPAHAHLCTLRPTTSAHVATTVLQVEQARDDFNDREATRLKKLARLTGVKDGADDSKPEAK